MTAAYSSAPKDGRNIKKCFDCPLPAADGKSRCAKCFASHKKYNKVYWAKYREKNREKLREYKKKYYAERGGYPALSKEAQERKTALERARRRGRVANGLCFECYEPKLEHSNSLCLRHWARVIACSGLKRYSLKVADALIKKLEDQNWKCPYTGVVLIPAKNCELDHIFPVSRFPDLRGRLDNVEWVLDKINRLKYDQTKEEFIEFFRLIARYSGKT